MGLPMHPDTREIAEHMREFGAFMAGRAIHQAAMFSEEMYNPYAHAVVSITLAAHAAEILIKARIAQEHPLLIFETLPKSKVTNGLLNVPELFEHGRTILYNDLPEKLWAATGYHLQEIEQFNAFGKLRNKIIHFGLPDEEVSEKTLRFSFEFIDVLLQDFWNATVAPYAEEYDDAIVSDGYLKEQLDRFIIKLTDNTRQYIETNTLL